MKQKMKPVLIILSVIFIILSCSTTQKRVNSQNYDLKIWADQTMVDSALDFEQSLETKYEILEKNVSLSTSVYPMLDEYDIVNPIIIKREPGNLLPVYAEYFFSRQDSILRYVSYDWERDRYGNFFDKQKIWEEESTKLEAYNQEYENIKAVLIDRFGNPTTEDPVPEVDDADYLSRNTSWETDGFNAQLSMIFGSMTYRIRLNYYWTE